uniref:Fucosyltransferase n=1 Tax=Phallusia mammillata TaxID=59560 RepID=A0A6F9DD67_9ASCI|nr:alpha-(1,3)-fucosyltransferase 7-like [Phallusia mammillata]
MYNKSRSTFFVFLVLIVYLFILIVFDNLIFEWSLDIDNWLRTSHSLRKLPRARKLFHLDKENLPTNEDGNQKPVILVWRPFFGEVETDSQKCPGCILTYDQSSADVAEAIVFHCVETTDFVGRLPLKSRHPKQRWVWHCMEPPWNVRYMYEKTLTPVTSLFNWTMTYRSDSDILSSYAVNISTLSRKEVTKLIEEKKASSLVAWVVSNCGVTERREIANELHQFIPIDEYGKCAKRRIASVTDVVSRYKFYLSFENSACKDYISEKFWINALASGTVPVVMGLSRSDYEQVAPPHSFIHVDDFKSTKELAEYLVELDKNDEMYSKYFDWRLNNNKTGKTLLPSNLIASKKYVGMCGLCKKLLETPDDEVQYIRRLDRWWFGKKYSVDNPHFSVCKATSGASGFSHHWLITLAYSAGFVVFTFIVWCMLHRPCGKGKVFARFNFCSSFS